MTEVGEIYKCDVCGNIIEVLHTGVGVLVCCGKPMVLQKENTVDASQEKHVPVIERMDSGIKVKVGSEPHPMEKEHHIEWIQIIADGVRCRKFLKPGEVAEATFDIKADSVVSREYCNLHGLWKSA